MRAVADGTETFLCPECGSTKAGETLNVSTVPSADPWSRVLQQTTCATHIAFRWDGLSVDEARRQWRTIYRPGGPPSRSNSER